MRRFLISGSALLLTILIPSVALAIPILPDTFEDGTTMGWFAGVMGGAPPVPPANVASGGPAGVDDNYLLITASGGSGSGSRLTAMNDTQWAGDYLAAGIASIDMDVQNLGQSDLYLRLVFEDPAGGPPNNVAFSTLPIVLPVGSGWTSVSFPIVPSALTAGLGSVTSALSNTTTVRIYHSQAANFPNPIVPIESVNGQLGVDNIAAVAAAAPEPMTSALLLIGLGAVTARKVRRSRRQ